jgi:hypothetical protein
VASLGNVLRVVRAIARQSAVPIERARPERLAANAENGGELRVSDFRRVTIQGRQVRTEERVPLGGATGEFL